MSQNNYNKLAPGEFYRKKGGRLTEEANKEQIERKIGKPEEVRPMLKSFHLFDKAHLVMLAEENLISKEDAAKNLLALREMEKKGIEKIRLEGGHGLHSGEAYLIETLGEEVGGRIHLGRSTGDLNAVAGRLKNREALLSLMESLINYRLSILKVAKNHLYTIMPSYTMYQHAQPTTFSHMLMWWENNAARDFRKLLQVYKNTNLSPAGAAIMTGSNFHINRERVAELLGFDGVIQNTIDAVFTRDYGFEALGVLTSIMAMIGEISNILLIFNTHEFRLIDFPDRYFGTSSIMPQKKNPLTLMKAESNIRKVFSKFCELLFDSRSILGGGYAGGHRLIAMELHKSIYQTEESINIIRELISNIKINKERMKELAEENWSQATDLAAFIVMEKNIPWRTAHQIIGILVRKAFEKNIPPKKINSALIDEAAQEYFKKPLNLDNERISDAINLRKIIFSRTLTGGPAPVEVKRQIEKSEQLISQDQEITLKLNKKLDLASEKLETAINKIIR